MSSPTILVDKLLQSLGNLVDVVEQSGFLVLKLSPEAKERGLVDWSSLHLPPINDFEFYINRDEIKFAIQDVNKSSTNLFIAILIQSIRRDIGHIYSKTVLITGSSGWLAQFITEAILLQHPDWRLVGAYHDKEPTWLLSENQIHIDFVNDASVEAAVVSIVPDVVLHLGAISSPVRCHQDRAQALALNCCRKLADTVKQVNPKCLFLFTSTDMVFDGDRAPYQAHSEGSVAEPVNVYGESKLAFEQYLAHTVDNWYALRLSNMLGPPFVYQSAGEKFLQFLNGAYSARTLLGLRTDEVRSFVAVDDVVSTILTLVDAFFVSGSCHTARVLNVGGSVGLSRLQVAEVLCDCFGVELQVVDPEAVESETTKEVASKRSKVSEDSALGDVSTRPWRVYAATAATPVEGALRSPRNITMVVSDTEALVKFKFQPLKDYIIKCLHVR